MIGEVVSYLCYLVLYSFPLVLVPCGCQYLLVPDSYFVFMVLICKV